MYRKDKVDRAQLSRFINCEKLRYKCGAAHGHAKFCDEVFHKLQNIDDTVTDEEIYKLVGKLMVDSSSLLKIAKVIAELADEYDTYMTSKHDMPDHLQMDEVIARVENKYKEVNNELGI